MCVEGKELGRTGKQPASSRKERQGQCTKGVYMAATSRLLHQIQKREPLNPQNGNTLIPTYAQHMPKFKSFKSCQRAQGNQALGALKPPIQAPSKGNPSKGARQDGHEPRDGKAAT